MFWKKKNKLPITKADEDWTNSELQWLRNEFGEDHFQNIKTVTPTKEFYERDFDGTEEDAKYILEVTKGLMAIDTQIELDFFSDEPTLMSDGTILASPADINGNWSSAAGTFEQKEDKTVISIETSQLKNPISLIATIAHELAHQILLGENRIEENDEYLTDLTAIFYGFGIFIANSKFISDSYLTAHGSGWSARSQGYLPEQIIAYAMAWLSIERKESTDYDAHFSKTIRKYYKQSSLYLRNEK